jgi:hypothetical protein
VVAAQNETTAAPAASETRPTSTSVFGDTGLWFVPTGEVLPHGRLSVSGYRINKDRSEAFSDISDFLGTVGFGVRDRVELFGSVRVQTRIDADRRPLLTNGTPMEYPFINEGWQTGFGDVYLGAKVNLLSQWRQQPAALAVRGMIKIPSANEDDGLGTGKLDGLFDVIASAELRESLELAGTAGFIIRGDPDGVALSNGFRWGVGAAFPSRTALRVIAELHGEQY